MKLFHELFDLLKPFINKMNYWRGPVRTSTKIRKSLEQRKHKKMTLKNEFLSFLMRLKLALLNEDIIDRFCVSPTISSNVFTTWIKVLNQTLGKALVVWLPKDVILEHLPAKFKKHHPKIRCVIDCSEVFIEKPKAVDIQAATWSDYKKHNTVKFLIGISSIGFITFLSDCYGGRASDLFICKYSGFYELLDPYDEIMADRGFQIREELLLRFCTLTVPPGARLKSQMTSRECTKTKRVANLRIHVERAINRIKSYCILKNTLPITMLHHCDDILRTCAALCNLLPLLVKWTNNNSNVVTAESIVEIQELNQELL